MEGVSSASGQNSEQKFDADAAEWDAQLNDVNNSLNEPNLTIEQAEKNGNLPEGTQKVLNNFIGNMTIEMMKNQNPAQKIDMEGDE